MKGLGTALITPFSADGRVDFTALGRLIDIQINGGVDYIVVLGTTGEAATLSAAERKEVREFIVRYVAHRLPLVLGLGGNNTQQVIEDIQQTDLTPYVAILSVCPYYNKPSQEGLFQHFSAIAEACPIPVILYNVPGRTGVNLQPETVMRIWKTFPKQIMGIKEASGNVEQIKRLLSMVQEEKATLEVISGDDALTYELMQAGAVGLISVAANAFPADFHRIVHDTDGEGGLLQERYHAICQLLFREGNPTGIKAVLALQGVIENVLRLPLVAASEPLQRELQQAIQK